MMNRFSLLLALVMISAPALSAANDTPEVAGSGHLGKILVIMTNHSEYPSRDDSTGLWLTELTHFTEVVEAVGYQTVFASPKGGPIPLDERSLGWLYMDDDARAQLESIEFMDRLNNTVPAAEVNPEGFDAIYYTGGHGVMWDFPDDERLQDLAEAIYAEGGVIAAVCHGVAGLVNLEDEQGQPLIQGRTITGFSNTEEFFSGVKSQVPFFLEDELVLKGARYDKSWMPFKSYVLADGRIITGQNPSSARAVAEQLVAQLGTNLQE
ncbi:type 1 glutamine amidotransferase domain-containing protein [Marinobacter xestospongiae]|uniref:Type 1 glutamine amidotransferase domain-containing protein n=1 Tax=Marinobacter xestospongiae TaxID=994319 RepID=A0ABU3W271_9GAMM|nr:type 1 glutamine amidotransferase domain-containing protein [Marinobacter xestospongiae]MDV2080639.1 type 1 glutamine amidotransferase domain-containing protein [Marinobacter xestospongiae]